MLLFLDENQPVLSLSYRDLYEFFVSFPEKNLDTKFNRLQTKIINLTGYASIQNDAKITLRIFYYKFKNKWNESNRTKTRFEANNEEWLQTKVQFKKNSRVRGRKSLDFEHCSEQTKRLKTAYLRENFSPQELAFAAQMGYRKQNELNASKVIKSVYEEPSKAKDYSSALLAQDNSYSKLSPDQAVSLLIEGKFTRFQYALLKKQAEDCNCFMYPSYDKVLQAKKNCYPENISVSEGIAEVPLQSLLNHTGQRLIHLQRDVLKSLISTNLVYKKDVLNLLLELKLGFDGSSGQSEYKQRFQDVTLSDFFTSTVPIKLSLCENPNVVIWKNSRPSSTRFCRPIKVQFARETKELTLREKENIESQINNLQLFEMTLPEDNICVRITFVIYLTMIDSKVGNVLTDNNSTQKCFICGASSKDFLF